jgi:hypothetical protein
LGRFANTTAALAYVLLGGGLPAVVARGVITGILFVVRPSYPVKVFSTVSQALPWLQSQSAAKGGSAAFAWADTIERFCAHNRFESRSAGG